jgi:hypothetical protein
MDDSSRQEPKQFRGRSWGAQGAWSTGTAPGADRGDPFRPPARMQSEREARFQRYAQLRQELTTSPHDPRRLAEAAKLAEDLNLTIEAHELWRQCQRVDPKNADAAKRITSLERRAVATGETGVARQSFDKPREQPPESPPFWTDLGQVLSYPFRGRGPAIFFTASAFFAVGEIAATFNIFFGGIVMLCLFGYMAGWHFDVASKTAAHKDGLAEFPEVVTVIDSCVLPLFSMLGCVLFAFAPTIVLAILTWQGALSPGTGGLLALISIVPCAFVFPMSVTVRALMQSTGEAMTPARVYGSIGRVLPDYLVTFVSLSALWFGWVIARIALVVAVSMVFGKPTADAVINLDYTRIVGWLVYTALVWPLLLYAWCVQGHLLGCLYRQSYKRLAWFVPAGPETARARRMSGVYALAGAGGAVLLLGGGWATMAMWRSAGEVQPSRGDSPLSAGTTLTYFWENTDGPAGLATFKFTASRDGLLQVNAEYARTGEWGVSRTSGVVALMDARSGVLSRGEPEAGGFDLHEMPSLHTRFFGPKRASLNSSYVNEWPVRAELRFKDKWDCWVVVHPETTAELYYDKASGVLVGRKFAGIGFTVTEWLSGATGLKKPLATLPPNRNFDDKPAQEAADVFDGADDDR